VAFRRGTTRTTLSTYDNHASSPNNVSTQFDSYALPPGLSFDAPTATISGTPTSSGVFQLKVRVDDATSPSSRSPR